MLAALFLLPPLGWGVATLAAIAVAALEWARLAGLGAARRRCIVAGVVAIGWRCCSWCPTPGSAPRAGRPSVLVVVCAPAPLFWVLVAPLWLRIELAAPRRRPRWRWPAWSC